MSTSVNVRGGHLLYWLQFMVLRYWLQVKFWCCGPHKSFGTKIKYKMKIKILMIKSAIFQFNPNNILNSYPNKNDLYIIRRRSSWKVYLYVDLVRHTLRNHFSMHWTMNIPTIDQHNIQECIKSVAVALMLRLFSFFSSRRMYWTQGGEFLRPWAKNCPLVNVRVSQLGNSNVASTSSKCDRYWIEEIIKYSKL